MARIKFKGPGGLVRELLKYARYVKFYRYPESGIVEMVVDGQAPQDSDPSIGGQGIRLGLAFTCSGREDSTRNPDQKARSLE